jgi:MFS family permease
MPSPAAPTARRIFYGWYVVYAIGFILMTTAGLAFYNLSVLLNAFVVERGFPVGLASGATATYFIASGIGGVLAGRLMDRFDPRPIMITGACVSAVALAAIGLLRNPLELYAFHVVFGFCYGCCGLVPATTIVARWFEARRPLALAVATTGLSLGGILVTPASAFLIAHWGLAGAAPWLALAMVLGVVPVTALIVRASPHAMDLHPTASNTRPAPRPPPTPQACRSRSLGAAGSLSASPRRTFSGSARRSAPSRISIGWQIPARTSERRRSRSRRSPPQAWSAA